MKKSDTRIKDENYWNIALEKSKTAVKVNSLIPLKTNVIKCYQNSSNKFELRYMISKKPLHLLKEAPKEILFYLGTRN